MCSDGQIWIGGNNVTWEEPKDRGIAMVFQSYALYPRMTVRGNMSFGLKVAGVPAAEIAQRVDAAAAMLKITELLDRRPAELSGGQRQRVAIGRALVRDAGVFCSTSRSPISTPSCAPNCGSRSSGCISGSRRR